VTRLDELTLAFDHNGLMPVIIQDDSNSEVLMLGYMNLEALRRTIDEGRVTFWSRSRQEFWRKGDTSGHVQHVKSVSADCDADTLLIRVDQVGAACHNGTRSCFETTQIDVTSSVGGAS
jgi:phosphoribosyl-AMP cyclohydrolase